MVEQREENGKWVLSLAWCLLSSCCINTLNPQVIQDPEVSPYFKKKNILTQYYFKEWGTLINSLSSSLQSYAKTTSDDVMLSFLPLAHMFERVVEVHTDCSPCLSVCLGHVHRCVSLPVCLFPFVCATFRLAVPWLPVMSIFPSCPWLICLRE